MLETGNRLAVTSCRLATQGVIHNMPVNFQPSRKALMQIRIPLTFALPVFFAGLAIGLIGLDFTFTHRFFLPEYGSEIKFFQFVFSLITLLGGFALLAWGAWLIQQPLLLEMQPDGFYLFNAWGTHPVFFPYAALKEVQVVRIRQKRALPAEDGLKERWLILAFDAHPQIPARIPLRFGLQYEHYTLRIATTLMDKKADQVASFLAALPGIATTMMDKD